MRRLWRTWNVAPTVEEGRRYFEWIVLLLWVAVTVFVAFHHEMWRDEADPWLYVRDSDFATIIGRTAYAGFPALWFLILAPLAKAGLPYWSQQVLHLAVATAVVSLFLWRAPFSRMTRLLFPFTLYFLFEYAVVVRSYALSMFLIFTAAALHRSRMERPIWYAVVLAMLFNVNAHSFFIAGVLTGIHFLDVVKTRKLAARLASSVLIATGGGVLAYLQLRTPADAPYQSVIRRIDFHALFDALGNAFLPMAPLPLSVPIAILLLATITATIWTSRHDVLFLWGSLAALGFIFVFITASGYRHYGYVLVVSIVALWLARDRGTKSPAMYSGLVAFILNAALLFSVAAGFYQSYREVKWGFSASREMAEFIERRGLEHYEIAAHGAHQTAAILPYLEGKKFWFAGLQEYGSYMKWDLDFERMTRTPYPVAEQLAKIRFNGSPYLLLFNVEIPSPEQRGLRLLYATRTRLFANTDENFWLYAPIR